MNENLLSKDFTVLYVDLRYVCEYDRVRLGLKQDRRLNFGEENLNTLKQLRVGKRRI